MTNEYGLKRTCQAILAGSLAFGWGFVDIHSSLSKTCGEYCEAKHARVTCNRLVEAKALKGSERVAEFGKCKARLLNWENAKEEAQDTRSSSGF